MATFGNKQIYLTYFIFLYEGVGNLFPWNAFINAGSYFGERFCGTSFQNNFENYFSLMYSASQVVGLAISVKYGNRLSLWTKIGVPLIWYSIIFLITTILVTISIGGTSLFWITLISTFISGLLSAVLSGGLFGMAAVFPPLYTGALMTGQGLAGVIVSIAYIVSLLSTTDASDCDQDGNDDGGSTSCDPYTTDSSALAYFAVATVVLFTCIGAYIVLRYQAISIYYLGQSKLDQTTDELSKVPSASGDVAFSKPLIRGDDGEVSFSKSRSAFAEEGRETSSKFAPNHNNSANDYDDSEELIDSGVSSSVAEDGSLSWEKLKSLLYIVGVPAFTVAFVFTVTLAVFPSIVEHLYSYRECSGSRFYDDLFIPFLFLLFNLTDFIGRIVAGFGIVGFLTPKNIWIPAVLRLVFIPLFLFSHVRDTLLTTVFVSDAFTCLWVVLLGLSNGYLGSVSMMMAPGMVKPDDSSTVGTIMIFCLCFGLLLGSLLSFPLVLISLGSLG